MLVCDGQPVLFGVFSTGVVLLIIGGCLWGSGEAEENVEKQTIGLVLFCVASCLCLVASIAYVVKWAHNDAKKRLEQKKNHQFEGTRTVELSNNRVAAAGVAISSTSSSAILKPTPSTNHLPNKSSKLTKNNMKSAKKTAKYLYPGGYPRQALPPASTQQSSLNPLNGSINGHGPAVHLSSSHHVSTPLSVSCQPVNSGISISRWI